MAPVDSEERDAVFIGILDLSKQRFQQAVLGTVIWTRFLDLLLTYDCWDIFFSAGLHD